VIRFSSAPEPPLFSAAEAAQKRVKPPICANLA
jgi:hypothetical protein